MSLSNRSLCSRLLLMLAAALPAGWSLASEPVLSMSDIERIEAAVDAGIVAGDVTPQGGVEDVHGLVRTGVVSGDFSDLPDQTATTGTEFGNSVALYGDWMAIGAPGTMWSHATYGLASHGVVFVFERVGGQWLQRQRILRPTGYGGARCGHSMAMNASHLVIGCPDRAATVGGPATGEVLIYLLDAQTRQFDFLERYYPDTVSRCGVSVALSRNFVAFGCPGSDPSGRVSVRRRNPATQRFTESEGSRFINSLNDGAQFGHSVALYEPGQFDPNLPNVRVAIGAPSAVYAGSIWPRGAVYIFQRALDGAEWSMTTTLQPELVGQPGGDLAHFGTALAMNRTQLVVGAPNNRHGVIQTLPGPGSVHRFSLAPVVGWQTQEVGGAVNVPDGPHSAMRFGAALALGWDAMTLIGAPGTNGRTLGGASAPRVGMLEVRRTGSGDWSVLNYYGGLRPGPLSALTRDEGRFGQALDADTAHRRVAVGNPYAGTVLALPRGAVWVYEPDLLFANGFQAVP